MLILYLPGIELSKRINIQAHHAKLVSILSEKIDHIQLMTFTSKKQLLKTLSVTDAPIIYFLGHTNKKRGLMISDYEYLSPLDINKNVVFKFQKPNCVILNTCYGVESGLKDCFIDKGAKAVIARQGAIQINLLCPLFEEFAQNLINTKFDFDLALNKMYSVTKEFHSLSLFAN